MSLVGNIKGPQGDAGATGSTGAAGTDGTNGSVWHNGAGTPAAQTGTLATELAAAADGDYYLNTTNGDVYKKVGGAW